MKYRSDIDGLRAISVIAVIIFHADLGILQGGYVGVDIFFVISGYLITGLIFSEVKSGKFSYANFYKRRIARLLPALIITLFFVFVFGFHFYDNKAFDNLGKEIFFSAIGAANILFAQGVNYFAQDNAVRPLIHLWSLGVEEQFYLVWPTMLVLLAPFKNKGVLFTIALLFFVSFYMAFVAVGSSPITTYFYPQYRAFELLIGAFVAVMMQSVYFKRIQLEQKQKEIISYISVVLIIAPMYLLNEKSTFPGINTLYSCIGAALFIAFAFQTTLSKLLSLKPIVFVGLISYPLYLYHQPIISYLHYFNLADNSGIVLLLTVLISVPLSWLTYRYVEKPIRSLAHKKHESSAIYVIPLIAGLVLFAALGMYVAKNNGIGERFKILNQFSYQVTKHSETTFHTYFNRGINLSEKNTPEFRNGKTLFIGDSLLQQYVYPLSKALNLDVKDIDTISRGGCVLLKGVDFRDQFADISCNGIRDTLYKMNAYYDYVVISQSWDSYDSSILNVRDIDNDNQLSKWAPFLDATIEHFKPKTGKIIIIGRHLKVEGTSALNPTIFLSEKNYTTNLTNLRVLNTDALLKSYSFFNKWSNDALIIHPLDIWSENNEFQLHNNKWSFFSDSQHASIASTNYIEKRIMSILRQHQLTNTSSGQ